MEHWWLPSNPEHQELVRLDDRAADDVGARMVVREKVYRASVVERRVEEPRGEERRPWDVRSWSRAEEDGMERALAVVAGLRALPAVGPENSSGDALLGGAGDVGLVALKAVLLYLTAVLGFRFARRRTLAQLTVVDFVAGAAVGAIVGRVPNSDNTSYLYGAVTLVSVLVAHNIALRLRVWPTLSRLLDHRPMVLIRDGELLEDQLDRAGITRPELLALLREKGVSRLAHVRYAILESGGKLSVIGQGQVPEPGGGDVGDVLEGIEGPRDDRSGPWR